MKDSDKEQDDAPVTLLAACALSGLILTGMAAITMPLLIAAWLVAQWGPWGGLAPGNQWTHAAIAAVVLTLGIFIDPAVKFVAALGLGCRGVGSEWRETLLTAVSAFVNVFVLYFAARNILATSDAALAATVAAFILLAAGEKIAERVSRIRKGRSE